MRKRESGSYMCESEKKERKGGGGVAWRYRFVPILYCHNSLFSCYFAQEKSNQIKYCLMCRRFCGLAAALKILIDRVNETFPCGSSERIVILDHWSITNEKLINGSTLVSNRLNVSRAKEFYIPSYFAYIAMYIFSVISRVLRAYIVQK